MPALLRAELRRIAGRRGSFLGSIAFVLVIIALVIVFAKPDDGNDALDFVSGAGRFSGLLGVVVMGALAGSYDTANGTMRYLVLTGVPRWQLVAVRLLGIVVAVLPMALIVLVIGVVWGSVTDGGITGNTLPNDVWGVLATFWTWGIVSTAIGMLMRSNGPAIAVSVVLFFGGTLITGLVAAYISETLANYLLPFVSDQVASLTSGGDDDYHLALGGAFAVLAAWLVVLSGAALLRVQRDEY